MEYVLTSKDRSAFNNEVLMFRSKTYVHICVIYTLFVKIDLFKKMT